MKVTLMIAVTADVADDADAAALYIDLGSPQDIKILQGERIVGTANGYDTGEVYVDRDDD